MNVLVACEESQAVCKAFRERGHRAFSCDIQECSGGHPEWHIKGDVLPLLNGNCEFQTADTHTHTGGEMGSDNSAPALHRLGSIGRKAFCPEAERRTATKSHRVFYADGSSGMRQSSRRKSGVHHVECVEKARPDNSALYVWRTRTKNNLSLVERPPAADGNGHSRPRGNCW